MDEKAISATAWLDFGLSQFRGTVYSLTIFSYSADLAIPVPRVSRDCKRQRRIAFLVLTQRGDLPRPPIPHFSCRLVTTKIQKWEHQNQISALAMTNSKVWWKGMNGNRSKRLKGTYQNVQRANIDSQN